MPLIGNIQKGFTYAKEFGKEVNQEKSFRLAKRVITAPPRGMYRFGMYSITVPQGHRGLAIGGAALGVHEVNKFRSSGRNGMQPTASGGYQGMY